MDLELTPQQDAIRDADGTICACFAGDCGHARAQDGNFPHEFHAALAEGGWPGIRMAEAAGFGMEGVTRAPSIPRNALIGPQVCLSYRLERVVNLPKSC